MRHVLFVCSLSTFWPSVNAVFDPLSVFVMGPVIGKKAVKLLFFLTFIMFNMYYSVFLTVLNLIRSVKNKKATKFYEIFGKREQVFH